MRFPRPNLPFLAAAVLSGSIACHAVAADPAPAAGNKPNIVFLLADDMGYRDAGYMGNKDIQTPNLDALAKQGSVLSDLYVQPVCSPTRSCLMTGRYVAHTGVYRVIHPNAKWGLPLEERTLAQALHDAGYETAIDGKWHLGEFEPGYRPMQRGYDHQYGLWFGAIDYFTHKRGKQMDWHRDDQPCDDEGYTTHLIAKEACRLIRERNTSKPLFLYVPFQAVHEPLEAPANYSAPYAALPKPRPTYAGMITAMDEAVGQILATLKEKGMADNTLVLFSSDNGGFAPGRVADNTPLRAGKGTIYEGGLRACGIASWPGHIPVGENHEPVHTVDWYPTLVKLAGGSLEQKLPLDGLDIWQVLTQGAKSPHDALLLCGQEPEVRALRIGDWKLLENPPHGHPVELYNLASDIGEQHDLAASEPKRVKDMQAKLADLMKSAVPNRSPESTRNPANKGKATDETGD